QNHVFRRSEAYEAIIEGRQVTTSQHSRSIEFRRGQYHEVDLEAGGRMDHVKLALQPDRRAGSLSTEIEIRFRK
ncbi:MAG: hypothetical protein DWI25_04765, partial [Planctomycetota bacterium]